MKAVAPVHFKNRTDGLGRGLRARIAEQPEVTVYSGDTPGLWNCGEGWYGSLDERDDLGSFQVEKERSCPEGL